MVAHGMVADCVIMMHGRRWRVTRREWLAAACASLAMACASSTNNSSADPEQLEDSHAIVQNDYWGDIDVFIITGAIRNRLGRVATGAEAEFVIPARLMVRPEVHFHVTPSAATTTGFSYQPISMSPGSTVELHVKPVLANSTYQVRGP
jgi:hypothetical protein